ncbi:S24 family peptidase [Mycoavidus cysteinexigens]|nr:S24 family peptidase [Mycoavidus cysteinexigens]
MDRKIILQELLKSRFGGSQAAMARALKRSPSQIHQWLSGHRMIGDAGARHIEMTLGLALGWMDGKVSFPRSLKEDVGVATDDEFALIPHLDIAAACGEGRFVDQVVLKGRLAIERSTLRDLGVSEAAARIIYAAGGSMWPTIQDGGLVLINIADITPKDGKVYAICTPDGGLVLKRLIWDYHPNIGAQTWIMRSDNSDKAVHPDKVLPPDDRTMIVGRAVWNDNRL